MARLGRYKPQDRITDELLLFFLAVLSLHCFAQVSSSCGKWGLLLVEVHRLLIAVTSLVVQALGMRTSVVGAREQLWLSGSRAQAQELWLWCPATPQYI